MNRSPKVRRKVAVKVIKPGMDTRQVVARFEAERQALALMDHPNIAKVLDGGETGSGRPYFVMELVKGVPITEYCDQNQVPIRERLELFLHVCQAVQHAHQKGIIHRDIKPSNVLIMSQDGTPLVKVIDFGVAKAVGQQLTDKTIYTQFTQLVGTPLYMSPEQAGQSGLDVDTRTDIYALGVLLYELLTGTTPFDKERLKEADYDEIRRIIREEEPPKPSTRISTLAQAATLVSAQRQSDPKQLIRLFRGELDWIVMKALEKDRNRRNETASAFAADVQRYLADEPVQACPPSAWYRLRKFARRNRAAMGIAALILFVIVLVGAGAGWVMRDRAARVQEIERDRLVREAALDKTVENTLNETPPLMEQGRWSDALTVVDRADKLLESAGRTERPARLFELQNDLSMAKRLEHIYGEPKRARKALMSVASGAGTALVSQAEPDSSEEEFFLGRQQDARFAKAFRQFGIDLEALNIPEAAACLGRTNIRAALVQALDQWAAMHKRAHGGNEDPFWKKLVEIARQADPDQWRNRFREALLRRDRCELENLADSAPIRAVPPATAYLLGLALSDLGALDKAITVLREAQRHCPDDFWLNNLLGWLSSELQPPRYNDAVRFCSMTVAVRPQSANAHAGLAEMLTKTKALDEALTEYSKAIELEPMRAEFWSVRGYAYFQIHQYEKAAADYSKAIDLDPKVAVHWNNRGHAYLYLHQYDKVIADCSKAIDLDPMNAVAWNFRGAAYSGLHQYEKAVADLSKAIELEPNNAGTWNNRGYVYNQLHRYEKAIADYSKVIEHVPKSAEARNNLAWFLAACPDPKFRDPAKAVKLAQKAVDIAPKEGNHWNTLGVARCRAGEWKAAIEALEKSKELLGDKKLSFNAFFLAMAHWKLEQKQEAHKWYDQAVQWMDKNAPKEEELRRFRAEAADLLGIKDGKK